MAYWRFDEGPGRARDPRSVGSRQRLPGAPEPRGLDWIKGPLGGRPPSARRRAGWSARPRRGLAEPHDRADPQRLGPAGQGTSPTCAPSSRASTAPVATTTSTSASSTDDALLFASRVWHRVRAPIPRAVQTWFHVAAVRSASGHAAPVRGRRGGRPPGAHARRNRRGGTLASTPYANPILVGAANNGADPAVVNQKLNGAVDELLIYDRALTARRDRRAGRRPQPRL